MRDSGEEGGGGIGLGGGGGLEGEGEKRKEEVKEAETGGYNRYYNNDFFSGKFSDHKLNFS